MARKYRIRKYTGVYFYPSKIWRLKGKPDLVYWIKFQESPGKSKWVRCGSKSEGWTAALAKKIRTEILSGSAVGKSWLK